MRKAIYSEINHLKTTEQTMCDAEKERIMLHLKKEIRTRRPVSVVIKTLSTVAASFVLLITAGTLSPVLAENIPFMQEIVSFLKQEQMPLNTVIRESDAEKYTLPANDMTEDGLQILETYCDGTALVLTAGLELPGVDENILRIVPSVTVVVNGERLFPVHDPELMPTDGEGRRLGMFIFHRTEGDRFVGALSMDVSHLSLTENFSFTLTLTELTGEDPKHMIATSKDIYAPSYAPKQYMLDNTTVPHTVTVPVDTSLCREYTVERPIGQLTVHKLVTTPVCTYLDVSGIDDSGYYYTLTTENGSELNSSKFDNSGMTPEERREGILYRNPLPEGTETVTVTVYSSKNDTEPAGQVEIPVDFGYASLKEAYTVAQIPESEIVFDPPLEELLSLQPEAKLYELGETVVSREGRDFNTNGPGYVNENATLEITYNNMQVYDSPADIGLTSNDLFNLFRDDTLEKDGRKFVTFDVTLKTQGIYGYRFDNEEYSAEIEAYADNDGTAGILWINNYAMPEALTDSNPHLSGEAAYFSAHPSGSSDYYHLVTNAYDTHNFVLGFYVPEELLESGNWRIGIATGEDDPNAGAENAYYSIPPVTLNK